MPARDELRYAGRAAGKLQGRQIVRSDAALGLVDTGPNRRLAQIGTERIERRRRGADGDDVAQSWMVCGDVMG
jgi:hypothetical protein